MKRIIILGAGISGLATAWYLSQKSKTCSITLFEKERRVGGSIQSLSKEGFLFERGPRGFRTQDKGKRLLKLVDELSLTPKLLSTSEKGKKRYLLNQGRLSQLSLFYLMKKRLLWPILKEPFVKKKLNEDETVFDFFSRRFGKKFATTLIDPMIRGIFGGDVKELSMAAAFPKFFDYEKHYGSLVKGLIRSKGESGSLTSFEGGMETLPRTIKEKLENRVDFRLGEFPKRLEPTSKGFSLHFDNETVQADIVIGALPAYELSSLLEDRHPFLEQIPYLTLSTLNLGFEGNILPLNGFGFLAPSSESDFFLGTTFDSHIFPSLNTRDQTRLCMIFKGEQKEIEALSFARKMIFSLFSSDAPIKAYDFHIAKRSVPQYALGHLQRLRSFHIPHLYAAGNYLEGISVIDCVDGAERMVEKICTD